MHRLDRKTLEIELSLRLKTAMRDRAAQLRSKYPGMADEAIDAIVSEILHFLDGPSRCVMRADDVRPERSSYARPGLFGKDEPWPAPLDVERHFSP